MPAELWKKYPDLRPDLQHILGTEAFQNIGLPGFTSSASYPDADSSGLRSTEAAPGEDRDRTEGSPLVEDDGERVDGVGSGDGLFDTSESIDIPPDDHVIDQKREISVAEINLILTSVTFEEESYKTRSMGWVEKDLYWICYKGRTSKSMPRIGGGAKTVSPTTSLLTGDRWTRAKLADGSIVTMNDFMHIPFVQQNETVKLCSARLHEGEWVGVLIYIKDGVKVIRDDVVATARALRGAPAFVKRGLIMSVGHIDQTTKARVMLSKEGIAKPMKDCLMHPILQESDEHDEILLELERSEMEFEPICYFEKEVQRRTLFNATKTKGTKRSRDPSEEVDDAVKHEGGKILGARAFVEHVSAIKGCVSSHRDKI